MKQTEIPLQTDLERSKIYLNKLWVCNHIIDDLIFKNGPGYPQYIRKDYPLRGQTLILAVTNYNNYILDAILQRLVVTFNRKSSKGNSNILPLIYNSKNWNYYKFEGFDNYSIIYRAWGLEENCKLDIYEILIDQSEDIEIYSHPINNYN